jgi:hypothetical protein
MVSMKPTTKTANQKKQMIQISHPPACVRVRSLAARQADEKYAGQRAATPSR